jgi:hypothetical protein
MLLPWREATTPIISGPNGQFTAGFVLVDGGIVGLVMLVRGSNILLAVLGILLALVVSFIIVAVDYSQVTNLHTSSELKLVADIGPGPYLSAVGVIAMVIGSAIGSRSVTSWGRRRLRSVSQVYPLPDAHGIAQRARACAASRCAA